MKYYPGGTVTGPKVRFAGKPGIAMTACVWPGNRSVANWLTSRQAVRGSEHQNNLFQFQRVPVNLTGTSRQA
jgi:hypothetical protein